jgi:hypothetical protein
MDERSDDDLLAATRVEPEAFAVFYRRHVEALLAYFARRTRDAELAADLTAETFSAALGGAHRHRPEKGPAIAWLYGIARRPSGGYEHLTVVPSADITGGCSADGRGPGACLLVEARSGVRCFTVAEIEDGRAFEACWSFSERTVCDNVHMYAAT